MSELYGEFHRLAQTEGNEPIRCSRMHFSEWADDVDKLDEEIEQLRAQLAACRALLREAVQTIDGHLVDRTWETGWIERAKEVSDE